MALEQIKKLVMNKNEICLNPCSNGMALEQTNNYEKEKWFEVLILVLMEWRWNINNYDKRIQRKKVLILVLMEWRWNPIWQIPIRRRLKS